MQAKLNTVEELQAELKSTTHLAMFYIAMFVSEGWYETYRRMSSSEYFSGRVKRLGLHAKTRGLIAFDRALNGEYYSRNNNA